MTRDRDGVTGAADDAHPVDDRTELHGAAAGIVTGLGAFFVLRHLEPGGGGLVQASLYDVPFILLSVSMLYAGYWLLRYDADHRQVSRVALSSLAGLLVLVGVGVWASGGRAGDVQSAVRLAVDVGTVGASSGLLVGLEGERRRRKLDRDASVAVDRAEDRFAFFNRMLRHHLLNGVAVVQGHAELLADVQDDPPESVEIIRRRCDDIVDLVRNVEMLSRTFTGDLTVDAVDPNPPLVDAIESARAEGADVEVLGDVEDGRLVQGNDRIDLVFGAVLDAAIEAADDDRVTVGTAQRAGEFIVSFAFDGSLPAEEGDVVRPGEYGDEAVELFLAETLLEYFGGSLDLPTGESRSAFTLGVPLLD